MRGGLTVGFVTKHPENTRGMYTQILLHLPFFSWPLLNTGSHLFLQKRPLSLCRGEELDAGSSAHYPFLLPLLGGLLSQLRALPRRACDVHSCCLMRPSVLFLIKTKPLGEKELLLASANSIGLKKKSRYGETDGYLCIQMVMLLEIKQWKLDVCYIYKRILVDPGICGSYQ